MRWHDSLEKAGFNFDSSVSKVLRNLPRIRCDRLNEWGYVKLNFTKCFNETRDAFVTEYEFVIYACGREPFAEAYMIRIKIFYCIPPLVLFEAFDLHFEA